MSRIGKLTINIPDGVNIIFKESILTVNGKFGKLTRNIPNTIKISENENQLNISLTENTKKIRKLHGLYRTLIHNMIIGVSEQFHINLVLKGVGYRAKVQDREILLNIGYSHIVIIKIPETISVEIVKNTIISLKSSDKEILGLFASTIRSWRKPEPYKGKGILYEGEEILRKAGKSGK